MDFKNYFFFVSRALVDIICRRSQLPVRKTKAENYKLYNDVETIALRA